MVDLQDALAFVTLLSTLKYAGVLCKLDVSTFLRFHMLSVKELRETVGSFLITMPPVYAEQGSNDSDSEC